MATTVEQYNRIKQRAEALQREADKAAGALEEQMRLLAQHGCSTIEEADKRLKQLNKAAEKAEAAAAAAIAAFEEEWGDILSDTPAAGG